MGGVIRGDTCKFFFVLVAGDTGANFRPIKCAYVARRRVWRFGALALRDN